MFCITLQGGLGNQLFQYAFGQMLGKFYNTKIVYDDSNLQTLSFHTIMCKLGIYTQYSLVLDDFYIDIERPTFWEYFKLGRSFLQKVLKKYGLRTPSKDEEKLFCYDESWYLLDASKDYSCTGYRNVAQYFETPEIQLMMRSQVVLRNEGEGLKNHTKQIFKLRQEDIQTISIHIRRGDYVKLGWIICDDKYYQNALDVLLKTIHTEKIHLLIFSNDLQRVKDNLTFGRYSRTYIEDDVSDNEQMILMSRCDHHIIANSTYSWWGAWLGDNKGVTVAPKMRMKDVSSKEIVPKNWIRI